mgnify:FL=1
MLVKNSRQSLGELNLSLLQYFINCLNIDTPIVKASDYDFTGKGSELVLDMCIKLKADKYIFGEQGKNYADVDSFDKAGIDVYFQEYIHPVYNQRGRSFLPYMSIIDLLFNEGSNSYDVLMHENIVRV